MQGELFNFKTSGPVVDASKLSSTSTSWLDHFRVTLRLDHLSIVAISALVLYVLVFSFGVEKGKRVALNELEAEKNKQKQIAEELSTVQAVSQPPPSLVKPPVETKAAEPPKDRISGKYTIQVITFTNRSRAEEEMKKLKVKGFQSFIIPTGKFFQVCVDAFEEMKAAKERLGRLKAEGFTPSDAYIRPLLTPQ